MNIGKKDTSDLDAAITVVMVRMALLDPNTEEYQTMLTNLERLYNLRAEARKTRINPDTLLVVAGNLLGILVVVSYEHSHVVASKALSFIMKPK